MILLCWYQHRIQIVIDRVIDLNATNYCLLYMIMLMILSLLPRLLPLLLLSFVLLA